MKLSKLYSNKYREFEPILFRKGLNIILGEIRLKDNKDKDTHNLGKSTFGQLLDFCLLKGKSKSFFLFANYEVFCDFEFFLELRLSKGSYLTLRRTVETPSKVSFKRHSERNADFSNIDENDWDHLDIPFEKAKSLLGGILNWHGIRPWSFRKLTGYLLRSQEDYLRVFQLGNFLGSHSEWKPFLSHLIGFDGHLVEKHYDKESELAEQNQTVKRLKSEISDLDTDAGKVAGLILLKTQEINNRKKFIDEFDFRDQDKLETIKLVDELDVEISDLNQRRYSLRFSEKKLRAALKQEKLLFNSEDASSLFEEAGVLFEGQIKKDFDQLIKFNRAITKERNEYLKEEKKEIDTELEVIESQLNTLSKARSDRLHNLGETDVFERFKQATNELVQLEADVEGYTRLQRRLREIESEQSLLEELENQERQIQAAINADVRVQNENTESLFAKIRLNFSNFVESVIDQKALITVTVNDRGHLNFDSEILDQEGQRSSASSGHSYQKLLCIAFDFAVLQAHLDETFPRFVYHDGLFETLDDRKKVNLLSAIRNCCALGIQSIVTVIDSDLPEENKDELFSKEEVILLLHDEGDDGRLFKMPAW